MHLKTFLFSAAFASALLTAPTTARAGETADPLFGDDAQARAVLDCHAGYARRFAAALTDVKATPTEIATAAYAHCIGQLNDFARASLAAAEARNDARVMTDPKGYQDEQVAKMRDYAFAYTLDTYLTLTAVL